MSKTGERLKQLRQSNNLTQKELADKIHKAESTISMWERGEREMDYEILKFFSRLFNVSIDYILGVSDVKQPKNESDNLTEFKMALYDIEAKLSDENKEIIISLAKQLADKN